MKMNRSSIDVTPIASPGSTSSVITPISVASPSANSTRRSR
jgi:hypothetical protein